MKKLPFSPYTPYAKGKKLPFYIHSNKNIKNEVTYRIQWGEK